MRLLWIELRAFRNHRESRRSLDGEPALVLGENGSGKSNLIEAIVLLSLGRSFRGARDADMACRGTEGCELRARVRDRGGAVSEIAARGGRRGGREVDVNGEPLGRLTDLLGRFPTVHFSVEDLSVLNAGPAARRRFLDVALCQLEPAYVGALREYVTALRARNRLLVSRAGPEGGPGDRGLGAGPTVEGRRERLARARPRDRRIGWTGDGPHRARPECRIGGEDLLDRASRGYARIYSILLRLALARVFKERLGEAPVVLLDDPESELDGRWIGRLLGLVPEGSQAIMTACGEPSVLPARFRRIPIETMSAAGATA